MKIPPHIVSRQVELTLKPVLFGIKDSLVLDTIIFDGLKLVDRNIKLSTKEETIISFNYSVDQKLIDEDSCIVLKTSYLYDFIITKPDRKIPIVFE